MHPEVCEWNILLFLCKKNTELIKFLVYSRCPTSVWSDTVSRPKRRDFQNRAYSPIWPFSHGSISLRLNSLIIPALLQSSFQALRARQAPSSFSPSCSLCSYHLSSLSDAFMGAKGNAGGNTWVQVTKETLHSQTLSLPAFLHKIADLPWHFLVIKEDIFPNKELRVIWLFALTNVVESF